MIDLILILLGPWGLFVIVLFVLWAAHVAGAHP
jgi:hypothetical protein